MIIKDHLVERKGLKQVERKELKEGLKVTHQVKSSYGSINQVVSSEYQEWFFGEISLLPMCRGLPPFVGKPSVVLGRLTWKWWSEEHLRCLVEANQ